jgi:guanylate kinase
VITGPSGVGKGTLIRLLLERCPGMQLSVSATTRPPREGEVNGREYHFLTREDFGARVERGEFIEHAEYAGNRYGTLRSELERPARGIVLEIEIQGARQVRETLPEALQVFIAPPSLEALKERLEGRASDTDDQIARRLEVAPVEMAAQEEFGKVVVNADLDEALGELVGLAATMCGPDEAENT